MVVILWSMRIFLASMSTIFDLLRNSVTCPLKSGEDLQHDKDMPAKKTSRSWAIAVGWSSGSFVRVCKTCDLDGPIGDCRCEFDTVKEANQHHFYPLLSDLVQRTFFKYFKVNLNKPCPFWHEEMMCSIRDCEVELCEANEVPPMWVEQDTEGKTITECVIGDSETKVSDIVRRLGTVDRQEATAGQNMYGWSEADSSRVWIEEADAEKGMAYINLLRNPERFTGYSGPSARRCWDSIYENCFEVSPTGGTDDQCFEKRIFYRLIAGLQSSISTHLSLDYYDEALDRWCPNTRLYVDKVGRHADRIHNLYFTYLFTIRAIKKAGQDLIRYDYNTGHAQDDDLARAAIKAMLGPSNSSSSSPPPSASARHIAKLKALVVPQCQGAFDETSMFRPRGAGLTDLMRSGLTEEQELGQLRHDFFVNFHNISRVMDCVGCEKCRLWGKLQTLGLGTAIKILLGMPEDKKEGYLYFQRNEIIALINLAHQLSRSIKAVDNFQQLEFEEILSRSLYLGGIVLVTLGLILALSARKGFQRRDGMRQVKGAQSSVWSSPLHMVKPVATSVNGQSNGSAANGLDRRRKAKKAD